MSEPTAIAILTEIDRTIAAMANTANSGVLVPSAEKEVRLGMIGAKRALLDLSYWILGRMADKEAP